jgi:hypothetical protein
VIRTNWAATRSFLAEAHRTIWSANGNVPIFLVRTLQDVYGKSIGADLFYIRHTGGCRQYGAVRGIVGIYGVIAYRVSQRTRGLRGMFVRHGLLLAGIGTIRGAGSRCRVTRLMSSLLFGITTLDPATCTSLRQFPPSDCFQAFLEHLPEFGDIPVLGHAVNR